MFNTPIAYEFKKCCSALLLQHCLNGQPCMILQFRFYRLLDYCQKHVVSSISNVVEEISMQEYQRLSSNLTVQACEVVMDSKGKRSANWSMYVLFSITMDIYVIGSKL